jgi:cell division septal protein FtsQ
MGLFSILKRKRKTRQTGFRDYQTSRRKIRRKPIKQKTEVVIKHDRIQKRKIRRQSKIWVVLRIVLIFAGIIGLLYLLFFTRIFDIQKIDVQGASDTLDEQAAITEYLQDYLGKNLILFNSFSHENTLLDGYPYLKKLKINKIPLHTIRAEIVTYDHIANIQMDFEDGSKQFYIVNELGYIASVGVTNETLPTIVMDVTGTDIPLPESEDSPKVNEELISKETLESLLEAKTDFEGKFNMQIMEIHYLKRSRELHLFTERYFYVWIDLTQSVDLQLAKLKKSMSQINIYDDSLDYIDLRISGQNGEKVIYKLSET